MTAWSHGYFSESPYSLSYQPAQTPAHLGLVCAMAGVAWQPSPRMAVLDIGCGRGLTVNILAAANPGWNVIGLDYNPAHIAEAQELAAAAGLANAGFAEVDLAAMTAAEMDQLPELDVVMLHGVWTWVADPVREGIVRLLARRLKPGGLCYVGYNALPGFAGDIALQRLLRHLCLAQPRGSATERMAAALEALPALAETRPAQLQDTPMLRWLLDAGRPKNIPYLVHEFMTEHWRPVFHADLCAALAPAKLGFVGSGTLHENIPDLLLDGAARRLHDEAPDGPSREFVKDLCLRRCFRKDVFMRGPRPTDRDAALDRVVLTAACPLPEDPPKLGVPLGHAELTPEMYAPIRAALEEGPQSLGRLRRLPQGRQPNPAELLTVLHGTGLVLPALRDGQPTPETRRLNQALFAATLATGERPEGLALATPQLAGGLPASWLECAIAAQADRDAEAATDPGRMAAQILPLLDGADPAEVREVAGRVLADRLPIWRRLGILAG